MWWAGDPLKARGLHASEGRRTHCTPRGGLLAYVPKVVLESHVRASRPEP